MVGKDVAAADVSIVQPELEDEMRTKSAEIETRGEE